MKKIPFPALALGLMLACSPSAEPEQTETNQEVVQPEETVEPTPTTLEPEATADPVMPASGEKPAKEALRSGDADTKLSDKVEKTEPEPMDSTKKRAVKRLMQEKAAGTMDSVVKRR